MENEFKGLEIDRIVNNLMNYFHFDSNAESFDKNSLITSADQIDNEHACLKEIADYYRDGYLLTLSHTFNLDYSLTLLDKDGTLSIKELSDYISFFDNVSTLYEAFGNKQKYEKIWDIATDLLLFDNLRKNLRQAILPDLTIADEASPDLYSIRTKLKKMESSFAETIKASVATYKDYLAEEKEVVKEGLPTLAVKSIYKNKVKGLVADISATGNTAFIIPLEILNLQNKIFELKEKENVEIQRILKSLSQDLAKNLEDIIFDYKICLRLDSLVARVNYGISYQGAIAKTSDEIYLEDVAHLMIDSSKVVRNTISLGGNKPKILIISGPNAGGKTVLIKSIGLACYMNQLGLFVPCLGECRLKVFSNIFFLSGDNQSIMDNLSTFSSHIAGINYALDHLNNNSLFIVDEIGQGTSPLDGEAIGVGVIHYLKRIGCFAILTSHYEGIKKLALSEDDISNGAMIFNEETIEPTFKFKEGLIGRSYALEVSKNLGMKEEIILDAEKYIEASQTNKERLALDKLQALQMENEKIQEEYKSKVNELERLTQKRNEAIDALHKEKQAIHEKAEDKINDLVDDELEKIELAYKEKKISLQEMAELKGKVNSAKKKISSLPVESSKKSKKEHEWAVGDRVRVISLNNVGNITSINATKHQASINVSGLVLKTDLSDLSYLPKEELLANKAKVKIASIDKFIEKKTGVSIECNLIGMREQEAREKLDKYMDDVILMGYHQVRIVHGMGSGILRKMVQNYMKNNSNVKSYRNGGEGEGGLGSTVVLLK